MFYAPGRYPEEKYGDEADRQFRRELDLEDHRERMRLRAFYLRAWVRRWQAARSAVYRNGTFEIIDSWRQWARRELRDTREAFEEACVMDSDPEWTMDLQPWWDKTRRAYDELSAAARLLAT